MNQKKLANLGLFAAVAIIFGYVESLIPFFAGIPGMKLGLAEAISTISKATSKGVYHKNNCARKISRLSKAVNSIG